MRCVLSAVLLLNSSRRLRVSHHQKAELDVTSGATAWLASVQLHSPWCNQRPGIMILSLRCSCFQWNTEKLTTADRGQGWPADHLFTSKSIFWKVTQNGPKYQKQWLQSRALQNKGENTLQHLWNKLIRQEAGSCAETRDLEIQVQELMQKSWRSACLDVWKRKHVYRETLHSAFLAMKSLELHPRDWWKMKLSVTLPRWLRGRNTESHH